MRIMKTRIRHLGIAAALCAVCAAFCACGQNGKGGDRVKEEAPVREKGEILAEIHVTSAGDDKTGDGTKEHPFATIEEALVHTGPGSEVTVHEGEYPAFEIGSSESGTADKPVIIRAEEGGRVIIRHDTAEGAEDDVIGIHIVNARHITIEGFEVTGGTHGIYYESTREAGDQPLGGIAIRNCKVHGVRGTHGICVYARNDLAPVKDLTMSGCEVWDCECGDSESTVFNGNIDGFEICDNVIHDNNNIGIDMIGFEGTAKHPKDYEDGKANHYEYDFVRNGICHDNIVYNISAEGNEAYLEDGEYDLCADGIYVDGGQDIEIYNNFIFNCDIGLEVATEHSPDDNELFRVSGIEVRDNVIADCMGWCGICFGGYDRDLGFTEECIFRNNTLVGNDTQIGVQRSRDNEVCANLIVGGCTGVEFNEDCRKEDLVNKIHDNAACALEEEDSWTDVYGQVFREKAEVIDGFRSLVEGIGSSFVPDKEALALYKNR